MTIDVVGLAAILFTLVLNVAAVAYWGGRTYQLLKDHDGRLKVLESIHPRASSHDPWDGTERRQP